MTKKSLKQKKVKRLRNFAFKIQGGKCFWCGVKMLQNAAEAHPHRVTGDHITPVSNGGLENEWNVVAACFKCNQERGVENSRELGDGRVD